MYVYIYTQHTRNLLIPGRYRNAEPRKPYKMKRAQWIMEIQNRFSKRARAPKKRNENVKATMSQSQPQARTQKQATHTKMVTSPAISVASLERQLVRNPPAVQETLVRFLGPEDPLEKG